MKEIICRALFILGICAILGIISGMLDCGYPVSNAWWILPIVFVMWVSAKVGKLLD
jgi:hypothetical protein